MDAWYDLLLHGIRMHWPVIANENIEAAQKAQYAGLQLADLIAGGLRTALEDSPYGRTEHRFGKTLQPITYQRGGNYLSYGLKFFPQGMDANDPRGPGSESTTPKKEADPRPEKCVGFSPSGNPALVLNTDIGDSAFKIKALPKALILSRF
jgi:hypothetical protein